MKLSFNSGYQVLDDMPAFENQDELIKVEPQFFSSDLDYVSKVGGPLTQAFIDRLSNDWLRGQLIFDSRVHMLMPGWYPCIPGYHLDDIPRSRSDGQPDHANPWYSAEHIMAIAGKGCLTEFIVGQFDLLDVPVGKGTVYEVWHKEIEGLLKRGVIEAERPDSGQLIQFGNQSFHCGTPATENCWRWFIRVSRGSMRMVHNKIRTQTQVYLTEPFGGW